MFQACGNEQPSSRNKQFRAFPLQLYQVSGREAGFGAASLLQLPMQRWKCAKALLTAQRKLPGFTRLAKNSQQARLERNFNISCLAGILPGLCNEV